jgi:hypothetical protein
MRSLEVLELKRRDKVRAKTKHLINSGKIIKTVCRGCGSTKVEAHHYNYDSPYSVVFLCVKHHKQEHARLNTIKPRKEKPVYPTIDIDLIIKMGSLAH